MNDAATAFAAASAVSFGARCAFVQPRITRTRPSPPRSPSRSAPHASALAERVVRTHEDAHNIEPLARTIASAFEVDPVMSHFLDARRADAFHKMLVFGRAVLRAELLRPARQSVVHVADNGACVAIWHNVGHWKAGGLYSIRLLLGLLGCFGLRAFNFVSTLQGVEDAHPTQPHVHLFIIGTDKEQQGKGYGSSVISEMLQRCDQQQIPAYLESSNERNLPFYKRHGFKVLHQIPGLPSDFPCIYALWRDPQPTLDNWKQ